MAVLGLEEPGFSATRIANRCINPARSALVSRVITCTVKWELLEQQLNCKVIHHGNSQNGADKCVKIRLSEF